jgi:hypothetical protein
MAKCAFSTVTSSRKRAAYSSRALIPLGGEKAALQFALVAAPTV